MKLRIDPWQPQYGPDVEIGLSLDELPEPSVHVDASVETDDWSIPIVPQPVPQATFVFIDGVRRIDFRVIAEDRDRRGWGLIGSFGVGAVLADGQATWRAAAVHRMIIIGGGLTALRPVRAAASRNDNRSSAKAASVRG